LVLFLLGSKEHIAKALRIRKLLGGAMRQVGFLAAAGIML
jgi:threonine aldolase